MTLLHPFFAAADIGVIVEAAVVLLIVIASAIGRAVSGMRQPQAPEERSPDPPARPVPADVADEIDEFLRRAAQRRGGRTGRGAAPKPTAAEAPAKPPEQPRRAEVVTVRETAVGGQLNEHVRKYLGGEEFTRRAGHLGEEVAMADRQVDQHLRQVFDHNVSQLAAAPGETVESADIFETSADTSASLAEGVVGVLSDPISVRQAIVLNEIFQRPEERWS